MAKTMMISNEVYGKLKAIKGERSFSEVINGLLEKKEKTGEGLKECLGIVNDPTWVEDSKKLRKELNKWKPRYA